MSQNYIYCYTNKINSKKYVGQTNNVMRRHNEHMSTAFNSKSVNYNNVFHRALRKYGIDNFNFEILEILNDKSSAEVDEREAFWIKEKHSLVSEHGYNVLEGGRSNGSTTFLSKEAIKDIKAMIKSKTAYDEICKKYGISKTFISDINSGRFFFEENEIYPLCAYRIDKDTYDLLIEDLEKPELTFKELSKKYGLGESTVKKFNYGSLRPGYYNGEYPIRKVTPSEYRAEKIIDLLLNSSYTKSEIVKLTNSSNETVRCINLGKLHHRDYLTYPLR